MDYPVTWFEIIGKDGAKTREFYQKAFGWKMNVDEAMNYGMLEDGGEGIAGGIGGGDGSGGRVTVYIQAADPQAALSKVESLGGKTVMPVTDIGMVTIAQFTDPEGNLIGLWKPNG